MIRNDIFIKRGPTIQGPGQKSPPKDNKRRAFQLIINDRKKTINTIEFLRVRPPSSSRTKRLQLSRLILKNSMVSFLPNMPKRAQTAQIKNLWFAFEKQTPQKTYNYPLFIINENVSTERNIRIQFNKVIQNCI